MRTFPVPTGTGVSCAKSEKKMTSNEVDTDVGFRRIKGREPRTQSIATRFTRSEEQALLTRAEANGQTLREWARDVLLRIAVNESRAEMEIHIFTELVGIQMLLMNALDPLLRGEKMAQEQLAALEYFFPIPATSTLLLLIPGLSVRMARWSRVLAYLRLFLKRRKTFSPGPPRTPRSLRARLMDSSSSRVRRTNPRPRSISRRWHRPLNRAAWCCWEAASWGSLG